MSRTIKQLLLATLAALVIAGAAGWYLLPRLLPAAATAAELDPVQRDRAVRFLDALDGGEFAQAEAMLDAKASAALAGGKLEQVWTALPKQIGARTERSAPRGETVEGRPVVTVTLRHEMVALDARIHFDAEGLIDGFRLMPALTAPAPVAPVNDERFSESELEIAGLPATLSLPRGAGPFPAVVLVHGSGPHDRDETIGPNKPFRDLAHGLAARGIAVLRYEKRSHARPQDFGAAFTLDAEVVDDAVLVLAAARASDGIDPARVFVLGHSLGGMAAPRIVARDPNLAGAILLAGASRPLHHIVPEQVRYLALQDGEISADEQSGIDALDQQRDALDAMHNGTAAPQTLMLGLNETYWRDLLAYDPAAMAATQSTALLILQGERDYQVTMDGDLTRWQQALAERENVVVKTYPDLNHLFMPGSGPATPQEYFKAGTLSEPVIADIGDWINAH